MPNDEHDDTPSTQEGVPLWQQVYADAVYREFKAGLEHSARLWGCIATQLDWKLPDDA